MENKNPVLTPKDFEFVNAGERLHDKKFDDKPISYFKDAWLRFCRNRASIVATVIIVLIILYAFITPLIINNYDSTFLDPYYAKNAPYVEELEGLGLNGGRSITYNERAYINMLAIGVGAEDKDGTGTLTLAEGQESKYAALNELYSVGMDAGKTYYDTNVNTYMLVGFVYKQVSQQEYAKIVAWQEETGIQVLYPLIASNEYTFDSTDPNNANWWYKTNAKGAPVTANSKGKLKSADYSEDLILEDNYLRDSEGNVRYYRYIGGGNAESAEYQIRVLYYNYYIYSNGFKPCYILGTDSQGYDLALRMAKGIQLSLMIAVTVSVINFILGAAYGAVEGYYGGVVDILLERVSDILSGVPFIVVATLFQMHLAAKVGAIPSLLFAFVMTGWIGTASEVRTQFYRFKNQEYVMAARTLGARDRRIIWKHIFPNSLGTIITSSALVIPGVIFSESMLSFLGIVNLGGSKMTSLGTLLSDASTLWTVYPHLMLYPAIIISLLMICFNLFGNGLRDAFNPSLRGTDE